MTNADTWWPCYVKYNMKKEEEGEDENAKKKKIEHEVINENV